jgi:glycosyltransferase involved in cell wall biosynthesis
MKVSVIIPVYNTGDDIDRCVESVLAQTLDDYEVIFVDDGSDDGTEIRLDGLAAGHDRIRVLHLPPSGGPGGPRNNGIDVASGDYVYFLDDDDWLGAEALERMHAMAVRNDSDIVIGRMVGHGRTVPRLMFRSSRDRADVLGDSLLGILTPHKLFRRSFLLEHGIRFPEGPVRLEDHRFVLNAYFRAGNISVLADYPCCHWVKRAGSYSRDLPDPFHYHAVLREVLDIVDAHVPPGPDRDRYYVHWYRGKVLTRLGTNGFLDAPETYRSAVYEEARKLTAERFGPDVEALLPLRMRVRSVLLRGGHDDALFGLLEAERGFGLDAVLDDLSWSGKRLMVRCTAAFTYRDGTRFAFPGGLWRPPVDLDLPPDVLDATHETCRLDLYLRRREDRADHALEITTRPEPELGMSGEAVLDLTAGPPLTPGVWDLVVRLDAGGWILERRLRGTVEIPARGRLVPYRTEKGNVSVRVRAPESRSRRVLAHAPVVHRALRRLRG